MKVTYADSTSTSTAYLDEPALPDGSYVGVNKHTDIPVHVRWDDSTDGWVSVCEREIGEFNWRTETFAVGPPPEGCSCTGVE